MLGNTILRALLLVTKALNCKLYLEHISRCSKPEAVVADHISKSNYREMRSIMPLSETFPRRVPSVLVDWVRTLNQIEI